ncbi:MAG: hypothetical protein ACK5MG_03425 [Bacteroidales bacterium]
MMKKYLYYIVAIFLFFVANSCKEDAENLLYMGDEAYIASFSLSKGTEEYILPVYQDSIVFEVAYGFDFSGMTANVVVDDGITISPEPSTVSDWSQNIDFKLTSANGQVNKSYKYIVHVGKYEKYYDKVAYLRTQQEVNEFGANEYTRVAGLIIGAPNAGDGDINDLSSLNTIEIVDYNLQIAKGFRGRDLGGGFDNLKSVTTLNVKNDSLLSLSFPSLESASNLLIGMLNDEDENNNRCNNLDTVLFPSLTMIVNNFYLNCASKSFEGFSTLREVGGEVFVQTNAANFKGLEGLTGLQYFTINAMRYLRSFEGLENLKSVTGTLRIQMINIDSIKGFAPKEVGYLNVNNCRNLKSLDAFSEITKLDNLLLSGLVNLSSLDGLRNLKKVSGSISLLYLGSQVYWPTVSYKGIENLDGLSNLESVGSNFSINYCYKLGDYSGLAKLIPNFSGTFTTANNTYNPTLEDLKAGRYTNE